MNKNTIKNIALILLLSITGFSMVKYVSELKARYRLADSLVQAQGEIAILIQEKQNLLQEIEKEKGLKEQLALKNANLKAYLRAGKNRIARLFLDSSRIQNNLEDVSARLSILKVENSVIIDSRKRIYLENEELKAKLGSVVELKKAIRELKAGKRKRRAAALKTEGNRGYLIKEGQLTSPAKIKIEVFPAQTRE
jgi:regulator of replication initiation timing